MGIYLIVIAGLVLRLLFIDKPDGMWNDEYISWMIAAQPLSNGFIEGVKSQCHMPFYYLYLKFFMTLFGQSDILLRLTSVLAGVLSIIAMYFVGLERDKKTGLICALITALSSFLIYYSQEVRFYSLLFLISAITLLYTIRVVKAPCKKNIILYAVLNFFILFTHTIGFVFVFLNLLYVSICLRRQYKKVITYLWISIGIVALTLTPLVLNVFGTKSFSQWWGSFSISRIGFLMTDYFSPILTNLTNAPDNFFYNPTLEFFIYGIIPALIAFVFIIKAIKEKYAAGLLGIAAGTVIVLVIAALSGKLVFLTKYSIEIYPILIFLFALGIAEIKNVVFRNSIISIYCIICIVYMIRSPYAAFKLRRPEGHKIVAQLIENAQLNEGDIILLEYYPKERFEKYIDFSKYNVFSINKGNFPDFISSDTSYSEVFKNGKQLYRSIFLENENKFLENTLNESIISKLKPNQNIAMVTLNSVSFYDPEDLSKIVKDDRLYEKEPLLFLVFSYIKNHTFSDIAKSVQITRLERQGSWSLIKFTKLN